MKLRILVLLAALTFAARVDAAPGPGGTITGVITNGSAGIQGGCSVGQCTISLLTSCANGQVLAWNNSVSAWQCSTPSGGGGSGTLTGSGTTGDLAAWTGSTALGNYAGSSPSACSANNAITQQALSASGALTSTCSPFVTGTGSGSAAGNWVAVWTSSGTIAGALGLDELPQSGYEQFSITEQTAITANSGGFEGIGVSQQTTGNITSTYSGNFGNNSSLNTTSAALTDYGVKAQVTGGKQTGTNTQFDVALYGTATGSNTTNYALEADSGTVLLNNSSSNTIIGTAGQSYGTLTVNSTGVSNFAGTLEQAGARVFSVAGTSMTSSGSTVSLATTAVTAGSYTNTNLTVNAEGQITAASSGTGGGITGTGTGGDLMAWNTSTSATNYAGSTPSACAAGSFTTTPSLSAAGVEGNSCTAAFGGTANTLAKFGTGGTSLTNSTVTDNGTTLTLGNVSDTITESSGAMVVGGSQISGGATGLIAQTTATAQTVENIGLKGLSNGSYNTTSSGLTTIGTEGQCASTVSSGTNTLTCIALYGTASANTNVANIALQTDTGNVILNNVSGTTVIGGATTVYGNTDLSGGNGYFAVTEANGETTIKGGAGPLLTINAQAGSGQLLALFAGSDDLGDPAVGSGAALAYIKNADTDRRLALVDSAHFAGNANPVLTFLTGSLGDGLQCYLAGSAGLSGSCPILLNTYSSSSPVEVGGELSIGTFEFIPDQSALPTAPTSGNLNMTAMSYGVPTLTSQNPDGSPNFIRGLGRVSSGFVSPEAGSTSFNVVGLNLGSSLGTQVARTPATTNFCTQLKRFGEASSSSAGSQAAVHDQVARYFTSATANMGGFFIDLRFCVSDTSYVTGGYNFVGLWSNTSTPSATASPDSVSFENSVGICSGSGDTNWALCQQGSTNNARVTLGSTFPINLTDMIEVILWATPGVSNVINYTFNRYTSGTAGTVASVSGSLTTNIPANGTELAAWVYRSNNATASVVDFDYVNGYQETPF